MEYLLALVAPVLLGLLLALVLGPLVAAGIMAGLGLALFLAGIVLAPLEDDYDVLGVLAFSTGSIITGYALYVESAFIIVALLALVLAGVLHEMVSEYRGG